MSVEPPENTFRLIESDRRPRRSGRAILFAGVVCACALGAGLGLWARPAMHERQAAGTLASDAAANPPPTVRKLQIVVDDHLPPPAAAPIEVLPAAAKPQAATFRPPTPVAPSVFPPSVFPPSEPRAPVRPPQDLIRTEAPAAPPRPLFTAQQIKAVVPAITGAIAATRLAIARAESPPPVRMAEARPPPESSPEPAPRPARHPDHAAADAKAAKLQLAKAQLAKTRLAKAQLAKAQVAKTQLAKAQLAKTQLAKNQAAAHRLELAQVPQAKRAAKAQRIELAQAEARGRAEALQEARAQARQEALADTRKRARLAAVAHALARALPHPARSQPVEMAKLDRRHGHKPFREPKVEQASLKSRHNHEPPRVVAAHQPRPRPEPLAPQPANGLMKVSTAPRCARSDPGEAAVCADPSLGAADRQLSRAYQGARAAGVPDAELRSQQMRWLAARSSAAREAPWAVRDVYMARIAELNGQAKDARDGY